jgi:hypothetical protein
MNKPNIEDNPNIIKTDWGFISVLEEQGESRFNNILPTIKKSWYKSIMSDYEGGFNFDDVSINSSGYRCNNFKKVHDGKHILFSGCSNAFGLGLNDNERWSEKVYKYISNTEQTSGFFNIARLGSSIENNVIDMLNYFDNYGIPNIIFWGIPNATRKTMCLNDISYNNVIFNFNNYEQDEPSKIKKIKKECLLSAYNYYKMFELICKLYKIKLISFDSDSFYGEFDKDKLSYNLPIEIFNQFESFFNIDWAECIYYCHEDEVKNKNKFALIARDLVHPGISANEFISNQLIKIYKDQSDNPRN